MHIYLDLPHAFSHIGQRTVNQDIVYPAVGLADEQTQLFIICDGMGGADKGEVASQLLCNAIVSYASSMGNPIFDTVHLQAALELAYQEYQTYLHQHPFVNRMGSTFALIQIHQGGVTVAHIGDSRIYQIRAGKVIFQTRDHKQVNDMVEAGVITATQALTHPWRNRLSRAVMASSSPVESNFSTSQAPESTLLTNINAGDYFFMCTDGVLELVDQDTLETLLAHDVPDQVKVESLLTLCQGQVKDNYSAYLIGVKSVIPVVPVHA